MAEPPLLAPKAEQSHLMWETYFILLHIRSRSFGYMFDVLVRIRTQFSRCLYMDRLACSPRTPVQLSQRRVWDFSLSLQNTCRLDGQPPLTPIVTLQGQRAAPLFHYQDEACSLSSVLSQFYAFVNLP